LPTLFVIALPLFFTYLLELVYGIFDTFALSATGIGDAGSVVLFSQIKSLLSCTGAGLISGAAILITSYLGRNDKTKARMVITQILYILVVFSILCATIFIGFGKPFLRLLQTPEDMINSSYGYYVALIISLIIGLFNSLYTNVLTSKGDTKKVLIHNSIIIITKVGLSSLIVFSGLFKNVNSTYLAIATIISELTLFVPALIYLTSKKSELSLIKEKPHKKMITKIIKLSLPIFLGGIIFNLTKVIINSMIVNAYGSFVLTFYGLEGLFFGVLTKYIASIQYAASTMTGQAMGSHKYKRVIKTYKYSLLIAIIAGLLAWFFIIRKQN
jgi:Na+-driven multidrug efflux pump